MLKLVQVGSNLPQSFILDPSAQFLPGQIAQLTVISNQVMATVSDGTAPIGIIDDIRTKAFTMPSWNEVVIAVIDGVVGPNGRLVTPVDIKVELKNPNIIASTFMSDVDCELNPVNGVVTFLAGTELNCDYKGLGYPNAIKAVVNYTFRIANIPGDDSTAGSGRVTVWFSRMFFQTDQFETNQQYPVNANLYVSEEGKLTTRRPSQYHPAVALLTAPPTSAVNMIEALWF